MVSCADPEGRGIEGSHPLLENHKFYGFLYLAFGLPISTPRPEKSLTPPPLEKVGPSWKTVKNEDKKEKNVVRAVFWQLGPDTPGKNSWIRAWVSQHPNSGHYRPASKTSFGWRFSGGPIMA